MTHPIFPEVPVQETKPCDHLAATVTVNRVGGGTVKMDFVALATTIVETETTCKAIWNRTVTHGSHHQVASRDILDLQNRVSRLEEIMNSVRLLLSAPPIGDDEDDYRESV